ncbi:MAG: regulatory signaling modulator protein AmpE [Gammaproteobacteria bacterium]
MKFIIILLGLALECGLHAGRYLYRFNWFEEYTEYLRKWMSKTNLWRSYYGVAAVVLPLVIVIGILYCLLHYIYHLDYLLAFIVLIYCFGPHDIHSSVRKYLASMEAGNEADAKKDLENFLVEKPTEKSALFRAVTKVIFKHVNQDIFAVLFWFVFLGPIGAVLYRSVALLADSSSNANSNHAELNKASNCVLDVLDWVPVRLLGIGYALVGNFMPTFKYWLSNVFTGVSKTHELNLNTGLLAIDIDETNLSAADVKENKSAMDLSDRTLMVYVILLALIVVGSFF